MRQFLLNTCGKIRALFAGWRALSAGQQRRLDAHFHAMHSKQTPPDSADAWAYAKQVMLVNLARAEMHIAMILVFLLTFTTRIFLPYGGIDLALRASLISTAMLFASAVGFAVMVPLSYLHIRLDLSLWLLTLFHFVICATVFSAVEPDITLTLQGYESDSFAFLFPPVLFLYAVADLFMLWMTQKTICYRHFRRQHKKDRLEAMVPADKRGEILLISAADHYMEIFTENGRHMRRMTMKAAVEKTRKGAGVQVHRSHWVAYSAMLALEKDGERIHLVLRNGQKVPVSNAKLPELRRYLDPAPKAAE